MKKCLCVLMVLFSVNLYADDNCGAAVDAADRVNPDADKNCDYTNTGLNGVLHRAFNKKSEGSDDESSAKAVVTEKTVEAKEPIINEAAVKSLVQSAEFSSAQQLQTLRFGLIQQTARECVKGFVVEGERYVPVAKSKAMKLELIYHCL